MEQLERKCGLPSADVCVDRLCDLGPEKVSVPEAPIRRFGQGANCRSLSVHDSG